MKVEQLRTIMDMCNQRWQMREDHSAILPLTRNNIVRLELFGFKLQVRGRSRTRR
jgi:hypothetical protein